jgi:hypothetical protein
MFVCVNAHMKATAAIATLSLLLGTLPGLASATAQPLQLDLPAAPLSAPIARPSAFARSMAPRPARIEPLFRRDDARQPPNRPEIQNRARDLGRLALENVLDPSAASLDEQRGEGRLQLKFNKRGNAFRDLNKSYRDICDHVSQKIWDDPNGKRIRFDVAGKPGVAFEIPVGQHH